MRTFRATTLVLLTICTCAFVEPAMTQSQENTSELPAEARERLDHIIGKWNFETEYYGRDGEVVRTITGTEEAAYIIDNRVVELTTEIDGSVSKAWLFYSVAEEVFRLSSVDAQGDLWNLSGGLEEYILTSTPKQMRNGRELMIRFTHLNIEADSFDAMMETSIDNGESWWTRSKQKLTRER